MDLLKSKQMGHFPLSTPPNNALSPRQKALISYVLKSCSEYFGGILLHLGRNIFVINYPYIVHAANVIQYNISLRVGCEKVLRGRPKTTLTKIHPILTAHLPTVDMR